MLFKIRSILTLFLCLIVIRGYSQNFTSSNLPILIVETNGGEIVDSPKTDANLKIVYQEDGSRNELNASSFHFDGKIGIDLRGQSSKDIFPKKGYGVETRDENGEDKSVSLLGMPKESDWVIHSPYSDKSLIRNALAYYYAGQIMDYAPRIQLCELVLNGEYLGVVLFTEKIKRDKDRVDVNKLKDDEISGDDLTGGYILKFDKGEADEIAWVSPYKPVEDSDRETRFLYHYPKPEDIMPEQATYIKSFITDFIPGIQMQLRGFIIMY